MQLFPQRQSLVVQTEAALLQRIQSGQWEKFLPGERMLSEQFRVSRWTLREALARLEHSGAIRIAQGKACEIMRSNLPQPVRQGPRRVALLFPGPLWRERVFPALWIDELRIVLNREDTELLIVACPKAYGASPARTLENLCRKHAGYEWVLCASTRAMQEWFERRAMPTCVAGSHHEGIGLPTVEIASPEIGVHVGHTLLGLGHRRIVYFQARSPAAGHAQLERNLATTIARSNQATLTVREVGRDPVEISNTVDQVLRMDPRPTALVTCNAAIALTVFTQVIGRGVKVPQEISLVSAEWEPYMDLLVPKVSYYIVSPAKLANKLAQALRAPRSDRPLIRLLPEFVKGRSLARAGG
ncbi:MAG: substrate-binding domain-containing protein [Opitutaceae bacterium]|nr:substrate-binding domain-containing protein [Opitutaceae bacterium]